VGEGGVTAQTQTTIEIPLGHSGEVALVDAADFADVRGLTWNLLKAGKHRYAANFTQIDGRSVCTLMHRMLLNARRGQIVAHRDGDGLNNRRDNILLTTRSRHSAKLGIKRKGKTSTACGVWIENQRGRSPRWCAALRDGGKVKKRRFKSEAEAVAWVEARRGELALAVVA